MKNCLPKRILMMVVLMTVFSVPALAQAQWNYISPVPGSKFINPENNIALRHGEVIDHTSIRSGLFKVTADQRGEIAGEVKLSVDGRTIIFQPSHPYELGEKISVEVAAGVKTATGMELPGLRFGFTVKPADNTEMLSEYYQLEYEKEVLNAKNKSGNRIKDLSKISNNYPEDFPEPKVTELDNPAEGDIFCTLRQSNSPIYNHYITILDKYGVPVYYRKAEDIPNDLKVIPGDRISYCNFDRSDVPNNAYYVLNQHLEITDTLMMGNGYYVDQHDLLVLENDDRFMMAYDPQLVDMSQIVPGGDPNATVIGLVIQRLDSEDNVIFQWRSWDHFEITDAVDLDLTSDRIDYSHGNAFELDDDQTTLMICSRHMNEITKINLETGDIIWRFGLHAVNNQFEFIGDTVGFCRQHDIRVLPNGNITLYDNGNCHDPQFSQSWEYSLDTGNMTATAIWNYIRDPYVYGRATGSSRRMDNGNTLICWGYTEPVGITEVTNEKSIVWELNVVENGVNYRAVKSTWENTLFEPSEDTVNFGTYDDYVPWPKIITITNNSDEDIEISSTHNYLDCYQVTSQLPLSVPAGETVNFHFQLFPTEEEGQLDDVLTLNYDSFVQDTLPQRVAQQVFLTAYVEDTNPPVASVSPEDNATSVARDTYVEISFNETVKYPDGSVIKSADLENLLLFKENDANGADVHYRAYLDAWKRHITIIPDEALSPGMQYYVELPGGTVADREGHVMEDAVMTTFTTIDDVPPTVEISPADSTTGVYINAMITYTFDEPVQMAPGDEITDEDIESLFNLKLNDETGDEVTIMGMISETKDLITIHPVVNLDPYQYYYIEMLPDMVMDTAGNVIEETHAVHFETGEELGMKEFTFTEISVHPNPTNGLLNIGFEKEGPKTMAIFDMTGKKLMEAETDHLQTVIDLSYHGQGIYLLKVSYPDGSVGLSKIIRK